MRRLVPQSLIGRVTLAAVASVGAALLVASLAVVVVSGRADERALDRELEQLAARAGPPGGAPPVGIEGDRDGDRGFDDRRGPRGRLEPGEDRFTRLVFADGTFVAGGASVPDGFPLPAAGETPTTVTVDGRDWRTLVRDLRGGERLQAAAELRPLQERQDRLRLVVLAALLGALLATALVTRSLARLALRPIERLRQTTDEITETGDLTRRLPVGDGPEEVDALGADLNAMLARLEDTAEGREAALTAARRFAADAGHELRTPLTSLSANLATGASGAAARDAARLTALVDQLQQLARGEAGPPRRAEDVDVADLADGTLMGFGARHPGAHARLEAPADGPVVRGEAESLRMLLDNLLENAVRHGRPGGEILVTVAARPAGGATLLVDDDGPGIPRAERAEVLERFARGSTANGDGTGLGLAIAAAQAQRHGGELALEDSPLGGLRVRVELAGVPAG